MDELKNSSPLLIKYLRAFEANRSSRVFAPLAETYRKIGMVDEALKVLREGIKRHPAYTLGYIVLAHCYYDRGNFEQAYNVIRPLVASNLDNTLLQKIFADTCYKLLLLEEALDTYKYLMFSNPRDEEVANKVKIIEEELLKEKDSLLIIPETRPKQLSGKIEDIAEQWTQVDLQKSILAEEKVDTFEFYGEKEASTPEKEEEELSIVQDTSNVSVNDETPVMTLTLVDLYCAQNLFTEAEEILLRILELSPTADQKERINKKLAEVRAKRDGQSKNSEGYEDLMTFYDKKMNKKQFKIAKVQDKFQLFLEKIQDKSKDLSRNAI